MIYDEEFDLFAFTESPEYKDNLKKLVETRKNSKEYKAIFTIVDDATILWWLEKHYPDILEEFKKWSFEKGGKNEYKDVAESLSKRVPKLNTT